MPSDEEWERKVAFPATRREAQLLSWNNRVIDWPYPPPLATGDSTTTDPPFDPEPANP